MLLVFLVFGILIILTIIGAWVLYTRWKRYQQFKCIILKKIGGEQLALFFDKAGIFVDPKTNIKRFFIKNARSDLDADNVPYIHAGSTKYVLLAQTGLKNFRYLDPTILNDTNLTFTVGEEDLNWAINAYERQKKMFTDKWYTQLIPFLFLAFVVVVILALFMALFKKFDILKDVALALKDAAHTIQLAHMVGNSTTIIA